MDRFSNFFHRQIPKEIIYVPMTTSNSFPLIKSIHKKFIFDDSQLLQLLAYEKTPQ